MSNCLTNFTRVIEYWASKINTVYRLSSIYYRDVIQKEIQLANITSEDRVLCIGGGICPFSAIMLHQATGAKITVIDNNEFCFEKSRELIKRFGLEKHIRILCHDGGNENLQLSGYSVIHFALQVTPAEYVFSQVEKRATTGTRFLVRRPKECLGNMYSKLFSYLLFRCKRITHNKLCNIGSTLLYVKKESVREKIMPIQRTGSLAA